jgi:hypothetical protein
MEGWTQTKLPPPNKLVLKQNYMAHNTQGQFQTRPANKLPPVNTKLSEWKQLERKKKLETNHLTKQKTCPKNSLTTRTIFSIHINGRLEA